MSNDPSKTVVDWRKLIITPITSEFKTTPIIDWDDTKELKMSSIKWNKFNFEDKNTYPTIETDILLACTFQGEIEYKTVFSGRMNANYQFIVNNLKFFGFLLNIEAWTYFPEYPK